ncbi:MAG TPA: hypothetical protein VJP40_06115, partial [bacterium]|nr:hypothetical protein [bacterium]
MKSALFLAIAFILGLGSTVKAATINVTAATADGACIPGGDPCSDFDGSTCSLQDALNIAECNGEDDIINVAAGTYDADAAGSFTYTAITGENFDLSVIGVEPTTILDGGDADQCLEIDANFVDPDDEVAILVDGITFQNGFFSGPGGGASILTEDGDVTVQNCEFLQNNSQLETGGGLNVVSDTGSIVVDRNNFIGNSTEDSGFAESGGGASLDTNSG